MRKSKIPEDRLLPYETICAATKADPEALNTVLRHFDGYIAAMATRIFYDEFGQSYRGRVVFPSHPGTGIWHPLHLPGPGFL